MRFGGSAWSERRRDADCCTRSAALKRIRRSGGQRCCMVEPGRQVMESPVAQAFPRKVEPARSGMTATDSYETLGRSALGTARVKRCCQAVSNR